MLEIGSIIDVAKAASKAMEMLLEEVRENEK